MDLKINEVIKARIDQHVYQVQWHVKAQKYVARVIGFPWLVAFGDSPESALLMVRRHVLIAEQTVDEKKDNTRD